VIEHKEDMAHIGEEEGHFDIEAGEVGGSNSRHTACRCYTSAADIADAGDVDCKASACPHLAAFLALPADDDRSSCRLGIILLPKRPRAGSGWRR